MSITIKSAELRSVKIAANMSEETIAFTGSLYINGKKAADCKNDGRGGSNITRFTDRDMQRAFDAYCEGLPPEPVTDTWAIERGFTEPLPMNADAWISQAVAKVEDARYWKRKCHKNVIVRLKSHSEGQYGQYKNWVYTPVVGAQLRTHYGSELVEIVNERFI